MDDWRTSITIQGPGGCFALERYLIVETLTQAGFNITVQDDFPLEEQVKRNNTQCRKEGWPEETSEAFLTRLKEMVLQDKAQAKPHGIRITCKHIPWPG